MSIEGYRTDVQWRSMVWVLMPSIVVLVNSDRTPLACTTEYSERFPKKYCW